MKIKNQGKLFRFAMRALIAAIVVGTIGTFMVSREDKHATAAANDFTFAAVGDHGTDQGNNGDQVFAAMGGKNISFLQSLGDLAYDPSATITTAGSWCQWAKNTLQTANSGTAIPIMLAAGNHEAQEVGGGFTIEQYTSSPECANPFASQTSYFNNDSANYSKNYYYDYPASSPTARFINISLGNSFDVGGAGDYSQGSALYTWISSAITSAKANNQWVFIINHNPYINENGSYHGFDFDAGQPYSSWRNEYNDLFNMLITNKADVIMSGHDHAYQRSAQLGYSTGCTTMANNTFNASCIQHAGTSGDPYVKGAGIIQIVAGMGGYEGQPINVQGDPDAGYITTADSGTDYGFLKVDVTATSLTGTYVSASGASYSDSFTIATTTDTTNPTVSVTSPTAGATISGTTAISATASDNVGVTSVEFFAGSTSLGTDTTSPYSVSLDTTTLTNGTYSLTAVAHDAANNTATSTPVSVTINNSAPAPSATFNTANSDGTSTTVALASTCSSLQSSSKPSSPVELSDTSIVSSFGFTASCSAAGGTSSVTVDLGKQYNSTDLRIFKDQFGGSIKDVTSSVSFSDQMVGGVIHTFINYSVVDGTADDTDGTINSSITDPVYVVLSSTTGGSRGATTTPLASTGTNVLAISSVAMVLIGIAVVTARKARALR